MVIVNEAFHRASDMDQDVVWREIESLARALLRSGKAGRPALELEALIPSQLDESACYHARVKRLTRSDDGPAAILVAVERRRAASPAETQLREAYGLTPREISVALLLASRRSNSEIADQLCLSPYTVRRHTERVLLKMGLQRRTEVAAAITGNGARRPRPRPAALVEATQPEEHAEPVARLAS